MARTVRFGSFHCRNGSTLNVRLYRKSREAIGRLLKRLERQARLFPTRSGYIFSFRMHDVGLISLVPS